MNYYPDMETQEMEIKTIKQRQFDLNLSDADVDRIFKKAGSCNLTVEELLENFVGDLVNGTYTNGSDERMYAGNWFERCGFSYTSKKSLLTYILQYDLLEDVVGTYEDIQAFKGEIQYAKTDPEEYTKEDIEDLKMELEDSQHQLDNYYSDYVKWAECNVKSLKEELKEIFEWLEKRDEKLNISR
jgi:hypothetical protein